MPFEASKVDGLGGENRRSQRRRAGRRTRSHANQQSLLCAFEPNGYAGCMSRLDRITTDPAICHGQPVVRGLRYPVTDLLDLLASGMTIEDVLADYPDLEREDLLAALEFGALAAGHHKVLPFDAA